MQEQEFDKARQDLRRAYEFDPANKDIQVAFERLQEEKNKFAQKRKKMSEKMLESLGSEKENQQEDNKPLEKKGLLRRIGSF